MLCHRCECCGERGAQLGCHDPSCDVHYHFTCANDNPHVAVSAGRWDDDNECW
jgi:hypothetical protein